jgi:sugar phosphate permease
MFRVLVAFSGAAEACNDPSFTLMMSMWYTRRQQPVRIGIWFTANGLDIAGCDLLGYGIGYTRGSLTSWKYEFLVSGAMCSLWGVTLVFFHPDSPVTTPLFSL